MAKVKEHHPYIVSLPPVNFSNLENIRDLCFIITTSDRGAVSKILARKVSGGLNQKAKSMAIGHAMNQLDNHYGGAGNYAYRIETEIKKDDGKIMQSSNRIYRSIQEVLLAEEIATKKGRTDIKNFFKIASSYLSFYNSRRR